MKTAVTVSLVAEARGGPFVFWDDLAAACEQAQRLGFDGIEIFPPSAESLDAHALRTLLQKHQLKLAAIGTGAGLVIHKLRLTDPDPLIRGRARNFVSSIIDFAGKFGAPAIIGSMQGRFDVGVSREQGLGWMAEALEQLGPRAFQYDVPLLIECLNRYETNVFNRVSQTVDFLSTLKTQNVKLLCDLFHMNIEEDSIERSLRHVAEHVGHVHWVDSNRQAAGRGHIQLGPVFDALRETKYDGFLSAEALPLPSSESAAAQTIESIRALRDGKAN